MIEFSDSEMKTGLLEASASLGEAGLHKLFVDRGQYSHRPSMKQLEVTSALEILLGTYTQVARQVEITLDTHTYDEGSEDRRRLQVFGNRYALYLGADVALQVLDGEKVEGGEMSPSLLPYQKTSGDFSHDLAQRATNFFSKAIGQDDDDVETHRVAKLYLESLKKSALQGVDQYTTIFSQFPSLANASILDKEYARFSRVLAEKKKENPLTWDDYAGQENIVRELKEISDFVQDPTAFRMWGAQMPKGVALAGPPGTGKTYLAQVFADVCGLPFHVVKPTDVLSEMYGKSAHLIREQLDRPGIVFIDEFESIARKVGDKNTHEATEQVVNTMKEIMDGFDSKNRSPDAVPTFYIGATNNPDVIEPALLRPGRMRVVTLEKHTKDDLETIFEITQRNLLKRAIGEHEVFSSRISVGPLASEMHERGFTPADINYLVQSLANAKGMEQKQAGVGVHIPPIGQLDLLDAINKYEKQDAALAKMAVDKMMDDADKNEEIKKELLRRMEDSMKEEATLNDQEPISEE